MAYVTVEPTSRERESRGEIPAADVCMPGTTVVKGPEAGLDPPAASYIHGARLTVRRPRYACERPNNLIDIIVDYESDIFQLGNQVVRRQLLMSWPGLGS